VEALVEQLALVAAAHEDAVQGPVEVVAAREAHRLERVERLDHAAGADGQAGGAQRPGEVHHVAGEAAAGRPGRVELEHRALLRRPG
jgi:hypothetical protein